MNRQLRIQLQDALATLAMPSRAQLERAKAIGVGIDELALEFDDVARARGKLVLDGELSDEQALAIVQVEAQLQRITAAGPQRWTDEAVSAGEDWSELRRLAQSALDSMT